MVTLAPTNTPGLLDKILNYYLGTKNFTSVLINKFTVLQKWKSLITVHT